MFHVLQQAMSEVVRSQADGVLTDEVVEQLLDTTYGDLSFHQHNLAAALPVQPCNRSRNQR